MENALSGVNFQRITQFIRKIHNQYLDHTFSQIYNNDFKLQVNFRHQIESTIQTKELKDICIERYCKVVYLFNEY